MADDQGQKSMGIDDLVRELSKSSTSPGTPVPAPQAPKPSFPTPKPPITPPTANPSPIYPMPKPPVPVTQTPPSVTPYPPKPLEMPKPKFNVPPPSFSQPSQPKPIPPPVGGPSPTAPLPTPGVKEYQSSIRTMNEDISRLKQGQQPTGVPVPRKVEQVAPVSQVIPPKPPVPTPQFKVPSVNLGEAQKTAPLAPSKDTSKAPSVPKTGGAIPAPKIYIPETEVKGGNRNMLFIGIGAVAVVAGFAYWFFILRAPAPEVVIETPTPTATPIQDLNSIFSGLAEVDIDVAYEEHQLTDKKGEFIILKDGQNSNTIRTVFKWLFPPQNVGDNFGEDARILLFVQSEFFDAKGQIKVSDLERRRVLIVEAKDASLLFQAVKDWETAENNILTEAFSVFWHVDKLKQGSTTFLDNMYQGVSVRYKNFPQADRSIDYAVVPASNGKKYFVIANSREAMYATVDKLKGL